MKTTISIVKALTIILMSAAQAKADIIKCTFSEPSLRTTYSTTRSELTIVGADVPMEVIKNVSFQIKAAGVFELVAKDGKVLQVLKLSNNGSDGASDIKYPISVKDNNFLTEFIGGCSSNHLKAK